MVKKFLIPILFIGAWSAGTLQAGTVYDETYTGAELLFVPGINFYSNRAQQPSVPPHDPDALFFWESATPGDAYEKLMEIPLASLGYFSGSQNVEVTVSANLTHIPFGMGDSESDPYIMLGDGSRLAGVVILDTNPTEGGTDLAACTDMGAECVDLGFPVPGDPNVRIIASPPPQDGEEFTVSVTWALESSTGLDASVLDMTHHVGAVFSGSGVIPSDRSLDATQGLNFVFLSDNQANERYQLNWISIRVETTGEPVTCNCGTPGLFDPPMDGAVSVKKPNRVLPLKTTLCDEYGNPLTDMDISAPAADVDYVGPAGELIFGEDDYLSVGHGDDTNVFSYAGSHWALNLQTKMFAAKGVYTISVVSTDPRYYFSPSCSVDFIIE